MGCNAIISNRRSCVLPSFFGFNFFVSVVRLLGTHENKVNARRELKCEISGSRTTDRDRDKKNTQTKGKGLCIWVCTKRKKRNSSAKAKKKPDFKLKICVQCNFFFRETLLVCFCCFLFVLKLWCVEPHNERNFRKNVYICVAWAKMWWWWR